MLTSVYIAQPQSVTEQATQAVKAACETSLLVGLTVTVAEADMLVDIHPAGSRQEVQRVAPLQKPRHRTIRIR